jgi:hypothetical protein
MLTKPRSESSSNETTVLLLSWVSLENPGDPYKTWDASVAADYMPSQYFTYRLEYNHRAANVPYFSGPGGVTPPGSKSTRAARPFCATTFGSRNLLPGQGSLNRWKDISDSPAITVFGTL